MIAQELLTAKGTIEGLLHLTFGEDEATVSELSEAMGVADGTARERLETLHDFGLVSEDAELHDGRPVRVYAITTDGVQVGNALNEILDDPYNPSSTEPEMETVEDDAEAVEAEQ